MAVANVQGSDSVAARLLVFAVEELQRGLPPGPRLKLLERYPDWLAILQRSLVDKDGGDIWAAVGRAIDATGEPERFRGALAKAWRWRTRADDETVKSLKTVHVKAPGSGPGENREGDGSKRARSGGLKGEVYIGKDHYYTFDRYGNPKVISSFMVVPTMRVSAENSEIVFGRAMTDKGIEINLQLPLKAFQSKRDLLRHLPSADLQWTGTDDNVQGLLRELARHQVPRRPGTPFLGYCKNGDERIWDSFRQHCRRIDYEGEIVDRKVLRRLLCENRRQGGYVIAESERVYFDAGADRRRAVSIDLAKAPFLDRSDFPRMEPS